MSRCRDVAWTSHCHVVEYTRYSSRAGRSRLITRDFDLCLSCVARPRTGGWLVLGLLFTASVACPRCDAGGLALRG